MNLVVGTINLEKNENIPESFDFDYVSSLSENGEKNLFIFGETEIKSSKEFVEYCEKELGKITDFDISIETENKIILEPYDYEEGIYEVASFEGEQVNFSEIKNRFEENDTLISVREAGISPKFGNKIIKVDFVF
ncbi:MAG: hypothetical protein Q9M94_07115 [Candidatus Gracilibacteria bacterium]|nr:hypothetical protein [Candidatus Gracilibacteria bacterium]MDQ7022477.1 hypothetical protein [Candidatus Gracilibacteria bacterium]